MRPIKSQNIVNNVVFPVLSALFSNSQVSLEGCSHSLKRSEFLQWGIRQRKFCKAIVASFVPQKSKKRKSYIFGKSFFDFPDIISFCLDVNVSCYSATSELSVCKACYIYLLGDALRTTMENPQPRAVGNPRNVYFPSLPLLRIFMLQPILPRLASL